MRLRSTIVLLLLVAGLGAFIWLHERRTDSTEQAAFNARYALALSPADVTRIQLASPALRVRFAKQGDGWHIAEPVQTAADDARVEQLLTELATLQRSHIITAAQVKRGKQRRADFGLDEPRWKISYGDRDRETIVNIGATAPTGDAVYLQLEGHRDIIVSPTNILALLPTGIADYRNRRLLTGTADEVSRLELRSRAGFVQAARGPNGTGWQIVKPVTARGDSTAILATLRALHAARIEDFEASSKVGASLYGFDEPSAHCSILARDGTIEETLLLGKIVGGRTNLVYATKQGSEEIFTVDRALLAALERSAADLRDARLLPISPQAIAAIRIEEGEHIVTIEATNGALYVTSPRLAPADPQKVALALAEWTGARVRAYNDDPGTNPALHGFAPPAARITFLTDAASRAAGLPSNITYEVSSLPATGALRTVRQTDAPPLLSIDANTLATLPARPLYYRSPDVLSVDTAAVRSITFDARGVTNTLHLDGTNPVPATAAAALAALRPLRARELITENAPDLTLYGLQPPHAALTIGLRSTGSVSRTVLIGNLTDGGARYATLQGLDLIFTLDPRAAAALQSLEKPAP